MGVSLLHKLLICSLLFFAPLSFAQEAPLSAATKVDGLELPADQTINYDEGFVNLQAKCSGEVKWLVISSVKVKYVTVPQNSIIISIPTQPGITVSVFAVGLVGGKMTEFAKTNITVSGNTPPGPGPAPNPPVPATGPLHFTFLVDMNNTTPELAQIINSQNVRQAITKGGYFRLYDLKSPIVQQKKLDSVVQKVGGNAILVVQRNDGVVVTSQTIPKTEAEIIQLVNRLIGGQ